MSSSGEVYGMHIMPDRFNADILLPNGLYMTLPCKREDTLESVKRQLWKTINTTAFKHFDIGDQSSFIFSAVTLDAKLEEFYEESRRLCDLRLFDVLLKIVEPQGNKEEKRLSSLYDLAIGKKINELFLELPRDIREEVNDFRKNNTEYENNKISLMDQGVIYSSYSSCVDVPFQVKIISATYVNVRNVDSLFVRAAIYHGTECLSSRDTNHVEPSNPKWDQWLKFDLQCTEIPRSAKICLSICVSNKKRAKEVCSLGTVNISIFDYKGYLRSGRMPLNLWPCPKYCDELLYPLGPLGSNPNNDSPCLLLEFWSFDRHVAFAPISDIYAFAAHALSQEPLDNPYVIPRIPEQPKPNPPSTVQNCHTHYSSIKLDFRDRTLSNSCADTRAFIERRLSSSSNNRRDSISTTYNENLTRRPTGTSDKVSAPSSRTSSTASVLMRNQESTNGAGPVNTEQQNIDLVNQLIGTPPFTPLDDQQRTLLWKMRFYCKRIPESLPKLLDAIDWKCRSQVSQLYVLLDEWEQVSLETALRLLHSKYEDYYVRQHAVRWLDECLDEKMLSCYLLQFVQVLKTEPYLENELTKFMTARALLNPAIGNLFFWYLRSECDEENDYYNTIRFRYLLEKYLRGLEESRLNILVRQVRGLDKLANLAEALKDKSKEERLKFMQDQIQRVDFAEMLEDIPDPINHNRFLGKILHNECRIMDSAKRPLWIVWSLPILKREEDSRIYTCNPRSENEVTEAMSRTSKRSHSYSGPKEFSNKEVKSLVNSIKEEDSGSSADTGVDGPPTSRFSSRTMTSSSDSAKGKTDVDLPSNNSGATERTLMATSAIIFKIGDDLRQDMLTLQIIRIVDTIWRQEGLDMCMLAYTCLSTGKNVGIIEVVDRAETITSIQKSGGRMATIQMDSSHLHKWIKDRNRDNYDEAIDRFTKSCAGYSVLTFVLGIADRNPDNIMVSEDGRIFHIDFGHFLGHVKKKFGINRERVPFVLTDDFITVIARGMTVRDDRQFQTFMKLCGDAYVSLRRHSNLLITLFTMMLRTGIPELKTLDDISYLKTSLQVGVSEDKAREFFEKQFLDACQNAWSTKVDWFFHNIKRM